MFRFREVCFVPGEGAAVFSWVPPGREVGEDGGEPGEAARLRLAVPRAWGSPRGGGGLRVMAVEGRLVPIAEAVPLLAGLPLATGATEGVTRSAAVWSALAKLAVELVAGQRVVPWLDVDGGAARARWRAALDPPSRARLEALAAAMPPAARSWQGEGSGRRAPRLMRAGDLARSFLDAAVDAMVRPHLGAQRGGSWTARTVSALAPGGGELAIRKAVERRLPELFRRWAAPALGDASASPVRLILRLEAPPEGGTAWPVRFVAEAAADPSLRVEAEELWTATGAAAGLLLGAAPDAAEWFLLEIERAARLWPALDRCLDEAAPTGVLLDPGEVVALAREGAPLLASAGIALHIPPELSVSGRRRLRARLRGRSGSASGDSSGRFALPQVLSVRWEAALGDEPISAEELRTLAEAKAPLVRWRDRWVVVDPEELASMAALLERGEQQLEGVEALRAAVAGRTVGPGGRPGELVLEEGDAWLRLLRTLREEGRTPVEEVPGLRATLRPYQASGVAWLGQLGRLGLGACLADDMGLGKTIQVIAHLLRRRAGAAAPSLVVCPTSVLGNWERELAEFAPEIPVYRHHGPERRREAEALARAAGRGGVVLTTYGVLRSDSELLGSITWDVAVLDEAQFIKNHESRTARAAFGLRARQRIALTGTPVENRLTDLWSIFAFTNPGLLGGVTAFRRELATPVERFRDPEALQRLTRLTAPFILRRTKSDPGIAPELPPRIVLRSRCTLTREQASLYQATLDAAMAEIESSEGMERRGRVLGLITALKQICNHPAQFLREHDAGTRRSGKLRRLAEELRTVFAEGDAVLLFTQYRSMGEILVRFLAREFAIAVPFLHGGVRRAERERMVARFQSGEAPPAMVISVRAGGTGINLTRASHVVHVDRWWNPAVENQATDRAHRIGQRRTVVVHAMVTAGTLEERIDRVLEEKAELARLAVRGGETWLTELADGELRELLALDPAAVEEGEAS